MADSISLEGGVLEGGVPDGPTTGIRRVTVVLDDDPTGTQEVTGVPVLLRRNPDALRALLAEHDAVFVLTNTRALSELDAVRLVAALYDDIRSIERELGVTALVVQRGDSTMRGHVFAEIEAAGSDTIAVFCPAFPAGGRRTVDGVHEVRVGGVWLNAADTEFAADPVFGYSARSQVDYVREKGVGWTAVSTTVSGFAAALAEARPRTVLIPDARDDDDLRSLAEEIEAAFSAGTRLVVRSAAPLAGILARAKSEGFLLASEAATVAGSPPGPGTGGLLVVVGSHTAASGAQLSTLLAEHSSQVHELDTDAALDDPAAEGQRLAERAQNDLRAGFAVIASARQRRAEHSTLEHAEAVMAGLVAATRMLAPLTRAVVAKGGITSAEVARSGLDKNAAWVAGQIAPGVSLWVLPGDPTRVTGPGILYAVVPGNIGESDTLREVVDFVESVSASPRE